MTFFPPTKSCCPNSLHILLSSFGKGDKPVSVNNPVSYIPVHWHQLCVSWPPTTQQPKEAGRSTLCGWWILPSDCQTGRCLEWGISACLLFFFFFMGAGARGGDRSVTLKFSCGRLPLTICFSFSLWSSIRGQRFKELIWWLLIVTPALWTWTSLPSAAQYPSGSRLC